MNRPAHAFACAALATALAASGCASSSPATSPDQIAQRDRGAIDARLQAGQWRLTSWRPDDQLEAMFQSLLAQQLSTMTITFRGGRILAESPTVHVNRAYTVANAAGSQFTLIATDENNVPLRTSAQISDDGTSIQFRGESEPWRGTGELHRM